MKDFGNRDGRPHREDTDGSQEGQPAYKAFVKDRRPRTEDAAAGERTERHRDGGFSRENSRYGGERRSYGYRGAASHEGGEQERSRTEGDWQHRERKPYDRNGEGSGSGRYGHRSEYGNRTYGAPRRPQEGAGEGEPRRKSYNPNFDEHNRPLGSARRDTFRTAEGGEGREGGYRRSYGESGGRYGDRPQEGRSERYAPREGREEGERGAGRGYGEREGGKPYGRSAGGDRHYAGGENRPYGERPSGERKSYGERPYATRGGGYGGRQNDRRPAGKRPGAPKFDSEHYPTFPAPVIEDKIRLNRYIAMSGICSRREADEFIQSGVVSVNGLVVTELGAKVSQEDEIRFNGNVIRNERKVYIVMNKPKGYVTSVEDPHADKTVMELLKEGCRERVYPVGRLDKNSLGVLLITNDGDMAKKLMHPSYEKKKVYQVSLDKPLTRADMDALVQGFELDDGEIHADAVSYVGTKKTEIGIEIHSGRNRIVRRMFEHLGYKVTKLDRVYFAGLTKQRLKRGEWRFLTPREVQALRSGQYE